MASSTQHAPASGRPKHHSIHTCLAFGNATAKQAGKTYRTGGQVNKKTRGVPGFLRFERPDRVAYAALAISLAVAALAVATLASIVADACLAALAIVS